jgi:hypothetical protein
MLLPQEIESSKFKNIYDKNLPDKNVEFFWYNFKESINNLLNNVKKEHSKHSTKWDDIMNHLNETSNQLNKLQIEEKYDEIIQVIQNYIYLMARVLFIPYTNYYHFNIFITNLKRWETWVLDSNSCSNSNSNSNSNSHSNSNSTKHNYDWLKDNESDDYFMIFFKLKKYISDYDNYKLDYDIIGKLEYKIHNYQFWDLLSGLYQPQITYSYQSSNKILLDEIYKFILEKHYFKPTLLIEFSHYYPVITDLIEIGYFKNDIPKHWSTEKALKKGINHDFKKNKNI